MDDILTYAMILLIARIASEIFLRLKLPGVIGIILAGIVCGPVLHIMHISVTIEFLAEIGILFLLFIAGLETNIGQMKQQGKSSIVAAILGVFIPLIFAFLLMFLKYDFKTCYTMGLTLTATSVSITIMTLIEVKALNTRSGVTILGSAVIDDVIAIILMTVSIIFLTHEGNLLITFLKLAFFFLFVGFYYLFLSTFALRISRRLKTNQAVLGIAVILMLVMAFLSNKLGVAAITGAYIAGVSIAKTPYRRRIIEKVSSLSETLFISVFFFAIGLKTTIHFGEINFLFTGVFIIIAIVGKLIGSGFGVFLTGLTINESFKVGFGMLPRGEVALVIATLGMSNHLINQQMFNSVVIMILITSLIAPIALKYLYREKKINGG